MRMRSDDEVLIGCDSIPKRMRKYDIKRALDGTLTSTPDTHLSERSSPLPQGFPL
jgi:hypothetical protein